MKPKILVIDDEEILTKTFARLLEKQGYEVFVAKRGADALEMAEEERFDLVICDIRMPGIDGVETIRHLREVFERKGEKPPPDIFITGYADQAAHDRAAELAPAAYIYKPFDNDILLSKVKGLLAV